MPLALERQKQTDLMELEASLGDITWATQRDPVSKRGEENWRGKKVIISKSLCDFPGEGKSTLPDFALLKPVNTYYSEQLTVAWETA